MKTLNLINRKKSDIPYEVFAFPDGQPHIFIDKSKNYETEIKVIARLSNPADLLLLLFVSDVLLRQGVHKLHLVCTYLLGARMDRIMALEQPFSLKVIMQLLSTEFTSISVFDPHSDTAEKISYCPIETISNDEFVQQVLTEMTLLGVKETLVLVSPDAGATKKTEELSSKFHITWVQALKHRDQKTGQLSAPTVDCEDFKGRPILIVDDICDGGGTFIQLAKVLKEKNAGDLYLAVSHGIFSRGLQPLVDAGFKHVFTTNSYQEFGPTMVDNFTVIRFW